jgi:hypothetical protein
MTSVYAQADLGPSMAIKISALRTSVILRAVRWDIAGFSRYDGFGGSDQSRSRKGRPRRYLAPGWGRSPDLGKTHSAAQAEYDGQAALG